MLTFRGAPPGKGLEAWRDNFSLKVGVVRIRTLVSKKYPIGKEGARARGPPDLGPNLGPWAQISLGPKIWAPGPKIWALGPNIGPLGPIGPLAPDPLPFGSEYPCSDTSEAWLPAAWPPRLLGGLGCHRALASEA